MNIKLDYRKSECGLSLIELMVTIVVVLLMSLAISGVLSTSEGKKRTLTSVNDINQAGNYAMYQLEKTIRAAGSGLSANFSPTYGCKLFSSSNGNQILPFTGASMAAPFTTLNTNLKGIYTLAPLIIAKDLTTPNFSGNTSDVLITMSGSAGFGEVPTPFSNVAKANQLNLINSLAFYKNDLTLIVEPNQPCMIQQVASGYANGPGIATVDLGGTYSANPIGTANLTTYTNAAFAINIGNSPANMPSFQLIGVGDNNVLFQYDLLQGGTFNTAIPIADGIFEMHALYFVDTNGDGIPDTFIKPDAANYDYITLQNGSAASIAILKNIKAIRLGLITRTALSEKVTVPTVTPGPLTLFSDLGATLTYTRKLLPAEQNFRYRTIELTIPLRNSLLLN
ncbi:PilW family protein [Undibacterium sp. Dicai25W]|uniref:PilW family protein n=1 Tax=Undibacterium sp. Dicai25W TaxID=3413034 RepID=UPI003BF372DF